MQDAWLAVLKGLHGFEGRSAFRTWVYRILVSTAKKRGVREHRSGPWSSVDPTVDPAVWGSPEEVALRGEIHTPLAEILDDLPARQRAVLGLRDVSGHTAQEVCDLLDITSANQRVLLHRARAVVRERLAGYLSRGVAHDVQ